MAIASHRDRRAEHEGKRQGTGEREHHVDSTLFWWFIGATGVKFDAVRPGASKCCSSPERSSTCKAVIGEFQEYKKNRLACFINIHVMYKRTLSSQTVLCVRLTKHVSY